MTKLIDDKTIEKFMKKNVPSYKEILETTMRISPFEEIGKKNFSIKFMDSNDKIKYALIDGELYNKCYLESDAE